MHQVLLGKDVVLVCSLGPISNFSVKAFYHEKSKPLSTQSHNPASHMIGEVQSEKKMHTNKHMHTHAHSLIFRPSQKQQLKLHAITSIECKKQQIGIFKRNVHEHVS